MAITVTGRGTSVTPALKDYVDEKIGRALEVFDRATMDAEVILRAEKNPANPKSAVCEVTVRAIGAVIRVAEADTDMYAAIDIASDKVTRQLRKYKTKVVDRRGEKTIRKVEAPLDELPDFIPEDEEDDLLGHDFYVYFDQDTHQIQVIYHRKNGGYGIIKPVVKA